MQSEARNAIKNLIGQSIDSLVEELYQPGVPKRTIQEPEITSRICQRLEDRLNDIRIGGYDLHVIAQSMPDRGKGSLEKITGADLFISFSLDGPDGFDKGIFIQTKYDSNINRGELLDACKRMRKTAGDTSSYYVWIYQADGVRVLSPRQVQQMTGNSLTGLGPRRVAGHMGRILDCYAGSKKWGIPSGADRRQFLARRLRGLSVPNGLDLHLETV
jgi:hypothetical protein